MAFVHGKDSYFKVASTDLSAYLNSISVSRSADTAETTTFSSGTGAQSIKAAIESDRTLGGAADSVRVTSAGNIGIYGYGEADYLGIEFAVEVIA